jgi:hypothetical protein
VPDRVVFPQHKVQQKLSLKDSKDTKQDSLKNSIGFPLRHSSKNVKEENGDTKLDEKKEKKPDEKQFNAVLQDTFRSIRKTFAGISIRVSMQEQPGTPVGPEVMASVETPQNKSSRPPTPERPETPPLRSSSPLPITPKSSSPVPGDRPTTPTTPSPSPSPSPNLDQVQSQRPSTPSEPVSEQSEARPLFSRNLFDNFKKKFTLPKT